MSSRALESFRHRGLWTKCWMIELTTKDVDWSFWMSQAWRPVSFCTILIASILLPESRLVLGLPLASVLDGCVISDSSCSNGPWFSTKSFCKLCTKGLASPSRPEASGSVVWITVLRPTLTLAKKAVKCFLFFCFSWWTEGKSTLIHKYLTLALTAEAFIWFIRALGNPITSQSNVDAATIITNELVSRTNSCTVCKDNYVSTDPSTSYLIMNNNTGDCPIWPIFYPCHFPGE